MSNRPLFLLALLMAMLPLFIDRAVSERGKYYDELTKKYERFCFDTPCEVDFDSDGKFGLLMIDRGRPPIAGYDSWLVATDSGRELFRLPHWYSDGSFRTHVAIQSESAEIRLILFDGRHGPSNSPAPPTAMVFVWDGLQLTERPPTDFDRKILSALAARDDSGTFNYWVMYEFMRLPVLVFYYLLLTITAGWLVFRYNRRPRSIIKNLP